MNKINPSYTYITKFSYKDGYPDGVAAESVRGIIEDTFAISESDGFAVLKYHTL